MTDSSEKQASALLAQMTLDEKLAQMGSLWIYELQTDGAMDWEKAAQKLQHGVGQITRPAGASNRDPVSAAIVANKLQKLLLEGTRLGIPAILHEECCLGALVLGGSIFPQMIGLASTFKPELAEEMTVEIRAQLMAIGARHGLAPVLDVAMDPRWGRIEETFGEDPTLVSHFGTAYVKGLQTNDLKGGVMATGKHFVGHSLSKGGLNCAPVHIGQREIYEVYLAPFQAAIRDADIATIMNSYPELDGEVVAASHRYLTEILREELKFDGLLVSDYEAVIMLNNFHFVAGTPAEAAALALNAGIDVELPTSVCYGEPLKKALEEGDLDLETIDKAVLRHLKKKYELGLFDQPYVDEGRVLEVFDTPEQRELAQRIAEQSIVLMKNDGMLPLPKAIGTLAVIGPNADSGRNLVGDYSYAAMSALMEKQAPDGHLFTDSIRQDVEQHQVKIVTVLEGIQGLVTPETKILYAQGSDIQTQDTSGIKKAVDLAQQAEAVVLVLGDKSGLTPECTTGETRDSANLQLPGVQLELAEAILETGKPVVLVLINGRPYRLNSLADHCNAILEAWLPGEEGGSAVASILFGDVNPGGKLPVTFPRSAGQLPLTYNDKPSGKKSHWWGDYVDESVTPLFPFGHGLSYSNFEYRDLVIEPKQATAGEHVAVSFRVKNISDVIGDEVVQLYIHDRFASIPRPQKELKGYQRLTLEPEEECKVTFKLPVDQLAFYNHDLELIVEAGEIDILVGSSSEDIRLSGEFTITGGKKMVIKERVFKCPVILD